MIHFVQQITSFVQKVIENCMSFVQQQTTQKKRHLNIVKLNWRSNKPSCAKSRAHRHLKQHYKDVHSIDFGSEKVPYKLHMKDHPKN